jgi:ribosomal protein L13
VSLEHHQFRSGASAQAEKVVFNGRRMIRMIRMMLSSMLPDSQPGRRGHG